MRTWIVAIGAAALVFLGSYWITEQCRPRPALVTPIVRPASSEGRTGFVTTGEDQPVSTVTIVAPVEGLVASYGGQVITHNTVKQWRAVHPDGSSTSPTLISPELLDEQVEETKPCPSNAELAAAIENLRAAQQRLEEVSARVERELRSSRVIGFTAPAFPSTNQTIDVLIFTTIPMMLRK